MKQKVWLILLSIFVVHLLFRTASYWGEYTKTLDGSYWKTRYEKSQWVVHNSTEPIGDDGLYAYDGTVLLTGADPSLLNPEVPPFGKYLIGITVQIFHNNNIFGLFTSLLALGAFYLVNTLLFKNRLVAFIPVLFFSLEPLFFEQMQGSFIDSLYLSMLCFTFFFFLRRQYILAGIFLGLFSATKFSPLSLLLPVVFMAYIFLRQQFQDLRPVLVSFVIAPVVLFITYLAFFLHGKGLTDFLKLQKYIYVFYAIGAKPRFLGMVFPMLFLNKWYTWWDGVVKMGEWTISWFLTPILFIYALTKTFQILKSPIVLCFLWILAYTAFLVIVPVYPRYLLLLLPFLYNVSVWVILKSTPKKYISSWLSL